MSHFFSRRVSKVISWSINLISYLLFIHWNIKHFLFQLLLGGDWVVWLRRHVGTGAVVHLGIRVQTPWWELLVGYTPALAPLWRQMKDYWTPWLVAGEGTREGGWGTFASILGSVQYSSAQKANEMRDDGKLALFWQSKVPLFAHSFSWVECLVPSCWMKVCYISWVLALYGLVEYLQWS
jgi:hypothetical protein